MARQTLVKAHNQSADLLRAAREAQGLTVDDMAEKMLCSRSSVLRYERDGIRPYTRWSSYMAIVRAYGVSSDDLLKAACMEA